MYLSGVPLRSLLGNSQIARLGNHQCVDMDLLLGDCAFWGRSSGATAQMEGKSHDDGISGGMI